MPETIDSTNRPMEAPKPQEIQRRTQFYKLQAIGLPILALIPLAAMFGLFDSANGATRASSNGIQLEISYPSRVRYETNRPLVIVVKNETGAMLPKAELEISRNYIEEFDKTEFVPDPDRSSDKAYIFELKDLKPGEPQSVSARMEFDYVRSGKQPCTVRVKSDGRELAAATFETFLFP